MKELKELAIAIIVAIALFLIWGSYVRDMHNFEPTNYNWPDELFGIRPK